MQVAQGNVGVAFALVIGAGLSTTLGATAAFYAKLASPLTLAVGLGLSAGVMLYVPLVACFTQGPSVIDDTLRSIVCGGQAHKGILSVVFCRYVSFVEIFMQKGVTALIDGGWGEDGGYRNGTLLLFAGMVLTGILDLLVHFVSKFAGVNEDIDATKVPEVERQSSESAHKPATDMVVADMEAGKKASDEQETSPHITIEHDHVRQHFISVPCDSHSAVDSRQGQQSNSNFR